MMIDERMIRRGVGIEIRVGDEAVLEEKLAVLQVAAEVAYGEVDRVSQKAGVNRQKRCRQASLKDRAIWTRCDGNRRGSGLAGGGTGLWDKSDTWAGL